jgi:transcriptional regulator with XRE-family HTH domain
MSEETTPRKQPDTLYRKGGKPATPIAELQRDIDTAAADNSLDVASDSTLAEWMEKIARADALRRVPLSIDTLELLAQLIPGASITSDFLKSLQRAREQIRVGIRSEAKLESECPDTSPADLFRGLRERAGMTTEETATIFGVTPATWIRVEAKAHPWYDLPGEAVPAFARAIREPVDRLLGLITLVARRALQSGIERRVTLSLGRFDNAQHVAEARRDTLRVAFARIQTENRGAAEFLARARIAADLESHAETSKDAPTREKP